MKAWLSGDVSNTRLLSTDHFDIQTRKIHTRLVSYVFYHKNRPENHILVGCLEYGTVDGSTMSETVNTYELGQAFYGPDVKHVQPMILLYVYRLEAEFRRVMDSLYRPHVTETGNVLPKRRKLDMAN
jgi:hypothetical protein